MRKLFLLFLLPFIGTITYAQETIIGYTFQTNGLANQGTDTNRINSISVENLNGTPSVITFTNGVTDNAATATNWDNGVDSKFWMIKVYTKGFNGISLFSKQRSGNTNPGPRDFKVQYRIGLSGTWMDLIGATSITLGNDWTSGVVNSVALPVTCDNNDSMIFIRWIISSNTSLSGADVLANGTSKIDDIFVKGIKIPSNIENNPLESDPKIYCFENRLYFCIPEKHYQYSIFDMKGQVINSNFADKFKQLDISNLPKGIYYVKVIGKSIYTLKFTRN